MNTNKRTHRKLGAGLLAGALALLPGAALAAPGVIADAPLYTAATAPPNIMFMVDNSGSMKNVVAQSPYDSSTDYTPSNCGSSTVSNAPKLFPSGDTVQLRVISGVPYAYDPSTSTQYALGKVCFTSGTPYKGELNASGPVNGSGAVKSGTSTDCGSSSTCYPGGTLPATYDGNYLNWYFSTTDVTSGVTWSTQRIKPTTPATQTRSEIARTAAKNVISTLPGPTFVGLSTYYTGTNLGAEFLVDINPLDKVISGSTTQQQQLDSTIDSSALDPSGYTPLAEAIMDVGRYFLGTPGSTDLTLWPNATTPVKKSESYIFAHTPHAPASSGIDFSVSHVKYSCQQNFLVLLTDGQPTKDRQVVSSTYTSMGALLGDYDKDCTDKTVCDTNTGDLTSNTSGITFPSTNTAMAGKPMIYDENKAWVYESSGSDYMDDVAKMLHDIDLDPTGTNDTTINNLTTYIIGFAGKSVQDSNLVKATATNGGGSFLQASDSNALKTAFEKATSTILATTSTASAVTFNSSTLSSESAVYQALFNTGRWSGDIRAYPLNGNTGAVKINCTSGSNCWSAADQLDSQPPSSRVILTYKWTPTASSAPYAYGIPFEVPADYTSLGTNDIDATELHDLCAATAPGNPNPENLAYPCDTTTSAWTSLSASAQTTQQAAEQKYVGQLVSFLRGDRSQENSSTAPDFRLRDHVLGDIVDSSPVFVGAPNLNWPDLSPFPTTVGLRYSDFKQAEQNRMGVVYAGSNDGMLHAFRATDSSPGAGDAGQEIMAYIPSSVYSSSGQAGLHYLADPSYKHRYYVDGTPTVSDVYTYGRDSTGAETGTKAWRTVLLGTLRGGGAGLFLLDVTNPSQFSEANAKHIAMWEFTNQVNPNIGNGNADLGQTFSKPTIAFMNNDRWAAVFGNGYNNTGDGKADLFIVYLDGGLDGKWTQGPVTSSQPVDDYVVLSTGVGSIVNGSCADASSNCNGLSTPALADIDGNGTVDRIYAGDLEGNMWVFNVSSSSDANWGVAYTQGQTPAPLFQATDASGNPQPITVQPVLAIDPNNSSNIMVVFGTGQYLTTSDPTNTSVQSMYGVEDVNAMTGGTGKSGLTRSNLVAQTISTASCGTSCTVRTVTNNPIGSNQYGWYMDLPTAGERVVVNPKVRNNLVFFNTLIPNTAVCHAGGSGWLMSVELANGGPPTKPAFDLNGDGTVNGSDVANSGAVPAGQELTGGIPTESNFLSDIQYTGDSSGKINTRVVDVGSTIHEGRYSWRELRPQ